MVSLGRPGAPTSTNLTHAQGRGECLSPLIGFDLGLVPERCGDQGSYEAPPLCPDPWFLLHSSNNSPYSSPCSKPIDLTLLRTFLQSKDKEKGSAHLRGGPVIAGLPHWGKSSTQPWGLQISPWRGECIFLFSLFSNLYIPR